MNWKGQYQNIKRARWVCLFVCLFNLLLVFLDVCCLFDFQQLFNKWTWPYIPTETVYEAGVRFTAGLANSSKTIVLSKGKSQVYTSITLYMLWFHELQSPQILCLPHQFTLPQIPLLEHHVFKFNVVLYKNPVRIDRAKCFSHFNLLCILRAEKQALVNWRNLIFISEEEGAEKDSQEGAQSAMKIHFLWPSCNDNMNI